VGKQNAHWLSQEFRIPPESSHICDRFTPPYARKRISLKVFHASTVSVPNRSYPIRMKLRLQFHYRPHLIPSRFFMLGYPTSVCSSTPRTSQSSPASASININSVFLKPVPPFFSLPPTGIDFALAISGTLKSPQSVTNIVHELLYVDLHSYHLLSSSCRTYSTVNKTGVDTVG
jgi:hypothetical protein